MSRTLRLYIAEICDSMDKATEAVAGLEFDSFASNWEKSYQVRPLLGDLLDELL
jgi:uncharacterized protein with HEPN domain